MAEVYNWFRIESNKSRDCGRFFLLPLLNLSTFKNNDIYSFSYDSFLLLLFWWAWFTRRLKILHVQTRIWNLARRSSFSVKTSCLWRNLLPHCNHLWEFQDAFLVTCLWRYRALPSALGPGAMTTTQIVSLDSWPRPRVLIVGNTAVKCCITTEDWCRSVTPQLEK